MADCNDPILLCFAFFGHMCKKVDGRQETVQPPTLLSELNKRDALEVTTYSFAAVVRIMDLTTLTMRWAWYFHVNEVQSLTLHVYV